MEEDWDLLRQIQEIDFNTSEYEDQCKKVDKVDKKEDLKEDPKEEPKDNKQPEDVPPTLAELRRLRLAKFSPS
jgi:hypothetical protein